MHDLQHHAQAMTKFFKWNSSEDTAMILCYTLELIQNLHGQSDTENGVDFYNSVFPGEVKMCLGFMSFRALSAALKQKNYQNSPRCHQL